MLAKKRRKRRSINEPDNVFYDVFDEGKKIQFIIEIVTGSSTKERKSNKKINPIPTGVGHFWP